ncbi:hypothetical protein [Streptomyces nigrescens]
MEQGAVDAEVARLQRGLIALRRDLRRHPEMPGQEQRTAGVMARELRAAGLTVATGVGGHGVVGVLRGARRGRDTVTQLHAAFPPFSGEDFALYLDRVPGTYTFLGVRGPHAPITAGYPHYPDFAPDERAVGVGVRGMAGWIAERTHRAEGLPGGSGPTASATPTDSRTSG